MALTVGRIWWLARQARKILGRNVADRYYTVCAMILESGALYLMGGIAFLVVAFQLFNFKFSEEIKLILDQLITGGAILAQLVAIAPTIIAVRVGLGYSVDSVDSFIAPARRTRPLPQCIQTIPDTESSDQVLYIHADGVKLEVV
ncbi:hypothetical protein B0H17DRAFT_1136558 [Mycena rosella]|uniref:Uncharacterized protein n=1 Tax=Mycena rosella TaxID=1033263 RepID=A0AAD7DB01_MYCRO|nr:hypothetical protein B0H17DRAFT_1136558 [Mycena rosella]